MTFSCRKIWTIQVKHSSYLLVNVQPFTVSQPLRWAFAPMASADFCLNNQLITELTAVDFHLIRSLWVMESKEPRHFLTLRLIQVSYRLPVKLTSPDKNVNCHVTTSSFTLSRKPWVSLSCANLPQRLRLL